MNENNSRKEKPESGLLAMRRAWIGEKLKEKPELTFAEMHQQFPQVSEMTLRRDVEYFEKLGEAIKVHGGARSTKFVTTMSEPPFSSRMNKNTQAKLSIAKKAAEVLGRQERCSVFLDSGTTVQCIVQFMPREVYDFTFTTTAPMTAVEMSRMRLPDVYLVGGMLDCEDQRVTGPQALDFISKINIGIAVMCASGFSAESGFTGGNQSECDLKSKVIKKAGKVIMLIDSSKIGSSHMHTFASLSDVDLLICDAPLPVELQKAAEKENTEVIIAE